MSEQTRHSGMSVTLALGLGLGLGALCTWSVGATRSVAAASLQQGRSAAPWMTTWRARVEYQRDVFCL
jgi:hypothetical protein